MTEIEIWVQAYMSALQNPGYICKSGDQMGRLSDIANRAVLDYRALTKDPRHQTIKLKTD